MNKAQFIARSKDELNKKLNNAISNTLKLPIKLQVSCQGWLPTGWALEAQGEKSNLLFRINGERINSLLLSFDKKTKSTNYYFEHSSTLTTNSPHLLLEISSSKQIPQNILKLEATDRSSPIHLLQLVRNDLPLHSKAITHSWMITSGFDEMNLLRQDAATTNHLNQLDQDTGRSNFESRIWDLRDDVQKAFQAISSPLFSEWIVNHGIKEYELISELNDHPSTRLPRTLPYDQRPFGVNLIGYASSVIGIGEDLRTCREALESIGIPTATIDVPIQHTS